MSDPSDYTLAHGGLVVGIDPAAHTGIVLVHVPPDLAVERCRLLASDRLTFSVSKFLSPAGRDITLLQRVNAWLSDHLGVAAMTDEWHVAIEEPIGWTPAWNKGDKTQRMTGGAFRLGVAYGLVLGGVMAMAPSRVAAYPPTNFHGRKGWMGGGKRDRILNSCAQLWRDAAQRTTLPPEQADWRSDAPSEDELMALGVVWYHLNVLTQERMEQRIAATARDR